jgi:hypothetical protein
VLRGHPAGRTRAVRPRRTAGVWTEPGGCAGPHRDRRRGSGGHAAAETLRREVTRRADDDRRRPRAARRSANHRRTTWRATRRRNSTSSTRVLRRASDHAEAWRAREIDRHRAPAGRLRGRKRQLRQALLATGATPSSSICAPACRTFTAHAEQAQAL